MYNSWTKLLNLMRQRVKHCHLKILKGMRGSSSH